MAKVPRRVVNIGLGPSVGGILDTASGVDLSNVDCVFHVKKNAKPEPNTAELKIYNLAEPTRNLLQSAKKLALRLEAGYEGRVGQLFLGEVRSAQSRREGADIITEVSTGDSEKELQTARIAMSVGPKVPSSVALTAIARALGVGLGNVAVAVAKLNAKGSAFFGPGSAIVGSAADALTDFCRSADLEWHIDDGVLVIVDRGKALEGMALLLSAGTGLVGSPTVDHKGIVSGTAFIHPDLRPGHKIAIQSLAFNVSQGYRLETCEYTGDTRGTEWYCRFTAKKY